jgi:H+/Cl- antiporter ClcA
MLYVPIPFIRRDATMLAWLRRYAFALAMAIAGVILAYTATIFWLWEQFDLSSMDNGVPADAATKSVVWPIAITILAVVTLVISALAWRRELRSSRRPISDAMKERGLRSP